MGKIAKRQGSGSTNIKPPEVGNTTPPIFSKPIFSLQNISNHNLFSYKKCSKDEKLALIERLIMLSEYPWSKIYAENRHGIGAEKVKIPKVRLSQGTPKDRQHYALRFHTSNKAFVGYKCENSIFHIIWIDRGWKLYDH